MTITPWTMYWLVKLDSLNGFFFTVAWMAVTAASIGIAVTAYEWDMHENTCPTVRRWVKRLAFLSLFSGFASAVLPTTKQMAAIVVIPAITNSELVSETVPREAGELYTLAKEWLRNKSEAKEAPAAVH